MFHDNLRWAKYHERYARHPSHSISRLMRRMGIRPIMIDRSIVLYFWQNCALNKKTNGWGKMTRRVMNRSWLTVLLLWSTLSAASGEAANPGEEPQTLEIIEVTGQRVANLQPASTYSAPVTALRYDPQVDIQARGLAEGQADVTVRGGLFENTGFKLGAVTIFDPQTGHYAVELPVDPDMLTAPAVLTGSANSINAFNASVATVDYGYADIVSGGTARIAAGSDDLRFASARVSHAGPISGGRRAGMTLAAAASEGDGTLPFGDHDLKRFAGHFQLGGGAVKAT